MKSKAIGLLAAAYAVRFRTSAVAQEHMERGPSVGMQRYQTKPGSSTLTCKWIRAHSEPMQRRGQEAGPDSRLQDLPVRLQRDQNDYDVLFCTLYSSYANALDYNKGDDDKFEAISAKHWATGDNDKQREMAAPRLRRCVRYIGTSYRS